MENYFTHLSKSCSYTMEFSAFDRCVKCNIAEIMHNWAEPSVLMAICQILSHTQLMHVICTYGYFDCNLQFKLMVVFKLIMYQLMFYWLYEFMCVQHIHTKSLKFQYFMVCLTRKKCGSFICSIVITLCWTLKGTRNHAYIPTWTRISRNIRTITNLSMWISSIFFCFYINSVVAFVFHSFDNCNGNAWAAYFAYVFQYEFLLIE